MADKRDVTKLSKWAQREIEMLRGRVKSLESQLRARDEKGTRVAWAILMEEHGLPNGAAVIFTLNNNRVRVALRERSGYGWVVNVNGDRSVIAIPGANNDMDIAEGLW